MTYITSFPREMMFTEDGKERQHPTPDTDQLKEFLAEFGATVAAWQVVESRLFILFQLSLGAQNRNAASAAFHSIQSFRGRLEAIKAAFAHAKIEKKAKDDWTKLSENLRKRGLKRNALAHGVIISAPYEDKQEQRLFIGPSPMKVGDTGKSNQQFTVSQLIALRESFNLVEAKLHAFTMKIFAALGPPAKSL
jgi:hypothetical protein